jgi:hypothetical protein
MGPFGPPVCKTDTEIADRNLKMACFDYSEKVDPIEFVFERKIMSLFQI